MVSVCLAVSNSSIFISLQIFVLLPHIDSPSLKISALFVHCGEIVLKSHIAKRKLALSKLYITLAYSCVMKTYRSTSSD